MLQDRRQIQNQAREDCTGEHQGAPIPSRQGREGSQERHRGDDQPGSPSFHAVPAPVPGRNGDL